MTTEQRLERLEKQNRWMRRIGAVGLAVVAGVFLVGQGKEKVPPDLVVRSLKMEDKDGVVRAGLFPMDADGSPGLTLADKNGKARAMLALVADSASLILSDKNGKARAMLAAHADGSTALIIFDKEEHARAVLGVHETVNKVTGAKTKTAENTLTMYDAKGDVIWQAPR